ncbi:unnamed protein product [Clonostachys rosea f. rosea IK726]|uniref:Uncharacterized protein n=2 Tax=Bionectria ochroleuca TaxID=29856 RepID=A0A0B7KQ41_BIOOC|nr:unnamed protein product [Clonostachys rosea f. rosea IK726]
MAEVTYIEEVYVISEKLDALLQVLFLNPANYSVKVKTASSPTFEHADNKKRQNDVYEITAPRELTADEIKSVSHPKP